VGLKRVKLLDARRRLSPDQMAALNAVATVQADWLVASAEAAARFDLPWEEVHAKRPCRSCGLGDAVHALTARLGLPHCPGCARRRRWLNRVTAGWVRRVVSQLCRFRYGNCTAR
jgi:hypothetical protein